MRHLYIYALGTALLLQTSCGRNDSKEAFHGHEEEQEQSSGDITLTAEQIETVGITLGHVEQKNLNSIIRVNGQTALNPQFKASVTSLVGGVIRSITVIEGNKVSKGQTVAFLENTEIVALQRDYLTARSEMTAAEQEHSRQKELSQAGAGVQKTLQQATAACHVAKAKMLGIEKQLSQLGISPARVKGGSLVTRIPIKSPIAGYVDKIKTTVGGYVDMQTPIMDVVDNSKLHCDLNIFEKDIADIRPGQTVDLILTNRPQDKIKGTVYEINSSFTGATKSVTAHVRITEKDTQLKLIPDMYLTGHIHAGRHEVSALPSDAVVSHEGKKYIFLLTRQEGKGTSAAYHFSRVEVMTGVTELGYTQVTPVTPLPAGATVVTGNAFYLCSVDGGESGHEH